MTVRMKMRFVGLVLGVCLLLGACGEQVQPPETEETQPVEETTKVVEAAYDVLPVEDSYYQYGNMQKNIPSGNFMLYGNEVVFEVLHTLYSYDLETGEVDLFCKVQDCSHHAGSCVSVNTVLCNLEQYGGKLYGEDFTTSRVRELVDGRFQTVIKNGRDSYWYSPGAFTLGGFWHCYGDLYVITGGNALLIYEEGNSEPRWVLEDYGAYWNVIFGRYLYGTWSHTLTRLDLLADNPEQEVLLEDVTAMVEGSHIYYVDTRYQDNSNAEGTFYLYRCGMEGENRELLLEQPVLPASLNFDDEYIYFRLLTEQKLKNTEDSRDIYRMSKADPSQIEKIATLPESAYQIFTVPGTGLLFVTTCSDQVNGVNYYEIYVMNTDGSDLKLLELPQIDK